ncbi:MAG: hypothetical protein RLZZ396_2653 [Planctomycetota bacterium]|jgi:hypothetical protein
MSSPFRYQSVLTFWLILIGFLLYPNRPNVGHAQQEELKVDASTAGQGLSLESATLSSRSLLQGDPLIVVRCMVKNSAKEPLTGIVSARLAGNLTDDDRYQLSVPPEQTLTCELTVRPPLQLPESRLEVEASLYVLVDGKETLVVVGDQPAVRKVPLFSPRKKIPVVAATALGRELAPPLDWRWEKAVPLTTYELAMASRIDAELTKDCTGFDGLEFPTTQNDWKNIDVLMLAELAPLQDATTLSTLKSFLFSGGRIWVMLDSIDPQAIEPLLEPSQQIRTIDSVKLTGFQVETYGPSNSQQSAQVELDDPVIFKRLMQQGGSVKHSIDGWPASIIMPVGRGELIITSLESSAWITPRKGQLSEDPFYRSDYELKPWAKNLVDTVQVKRGGSILPLKSLEYPLERIGNPVVSRGIVAGILLGFCTALIGMSLWRLTAKDAKAMGWIAPALAIGASLPMVYIAWSQKKDKPPMVSLFQLVQLESKSGATMKESAAVYLPQDTSMSLVSNSLGFASPDPKMETGIKTITTEDFGKWKMSNQAWPTGTWRYQTDVALPELQAVAQADFTQSGVRITLPSNLPSKVQDPVVAYVPGAPALGSSSSESEILVDGKYAAEGERWTLDAIVGDEQRRRTNIYKNILDSNDRSLTLSRTVLGWTDLFDQGPRWNTEIERRGVALVSMPLILSRPAPGSSVAIPFPFIDIKLAKNANSSPIFLEGTGRWISQSSTPAETSLDFRLPDEVLPLSPTHIDFDWDLQIPRRKVKLSWFRSKDQSLVEIISFNGPSIPWKSTLTDPDLLEEFQDGLLTLRLEVAEDHGREVSEGQVVGSSIPWRIKHLRLQVRGTTLPSNPLKP